MALDNTTQGLSLSIVVLGEAISYGFPVAIAGWLTRDSSESGDMTARGLFVGLATLDVVQLVEALPEPNQKIKALRFSMAAGGPAANAAVAFAHDYSACGLGGHDEAVLVTRVSSDEIGALIRADLTAHRVDVKALDFELFPVCWTV